ACDPGTPRSPYLDYEHLFDERLTVLLADRHPLARKKRVRPEELVEHPLILPPDGGADRKALDRLFRKHNLADRVRVAVISSLVDVTREYVAAGVGVAVMYVTDAVARAGGPGLRLRPLDAETEPLPIEMAVRRGAHLPEHVEAFRRAVRECLSAT